MKSTYHIKIRTVLWAALVMVCFAATLVTSSTWAQSGCFIDKYGTRACPVGPDPGGGSGNTSPGPSGPSPEEVKQQQERQRLKAKAWSSDEALDYFDRKDWDNAIRSFEEALDRDPDDPDLNNWLKRAKAEKAKAQMPAVAAPSRPAPTNDNKVVDTRNEPAGLGGKSKSKGTPGTPKSAPSGDPMVVDARNVPSGLPKALDNAIATAYSSAPPGVSDRVRKGFQAVMVRDWKVAKAWFQDALNRDPTNAGLKRLVALTDAPQQPNPPRATVDAHNEPVGLGGKSDAKGASAAPGKTKHAPASTTGAQVQLPDPNDIYLMFPGLKAIEDKQALDYLFGLNAQPPVSKSGKTK
jgi:tetratricopeptide (TPR) repeat protein